MLIVARRERRKGRVWKGFRTARFTVFPSRDLFLKQIQLNFQDVKIDSAERLSFNTKPFHDVLGFRNKVLNGLPQVHRSQS